MKDTKKTILIVEDDPFLLKMYRRPLETEGFQVESAEDGLAALDVLPQLKPDLVVLDLMLPELHGLNVLKSIRADAQLKATPVLILSNVFMGEMASKAMAAGANRGMLKTECTPAKLLGAVCQLLGNTNESQSQGGSPAGPPSVAGPATLTKEPALENARAELLRDAPEEIAKVREQCLAYIKAAGSQARLEHLSNLYRGVRFLSARAGLSGFTRATHLASALEALLFEIVFNYSAATPSTLQTIARAVDCLGRLFQKGHSGPMEPTRKPKILVVDDDAVCNYLTVAALKRAELDAVSVQDTKIAIQTLKTTQFDLVLLDVDMPVFTGFEVCEMLRRLPQYKTTPVIFITVNGEFRNRAHSALSGGNDFITKPISPLELALKTTVHLVEAQGRVADEPQVEAAVRVPEPPPFPRMPAIPSQQVTDQPALVPQDVCVAAAQRADLGQNEALQPCLSVDGALFSNGQPVKTPTGDAVMALGPTAELRVSDAPADIAQPILIAQTGQSGNHNPQAAVSTNHLPDAGERSATAVPNAPEQTASTPPSHSPTIDEERTPPMVSERQNFPGAEASSETPQSQQLRLPQSGDSERAYPPANDKNPDASMKNQNENNRTFEQIVQVVARILFGDDNLPDMNVRLTRLALERYSIREIVNAFEADAQGNGSRSTKAEEHTQAFDQIALGVTHVIFGDEDPPAMNVRLTRIALERYHVPEMISGATEPSARGEEPISGQHPRAAIPFGTSVAQG